MKNNLLIIFFCIFFYNSLFAESILIESKNITIDKNSEVSVFKNEVIVKTEENNLIKSDYAEYNKIKGFLKLKNNVEAVDKHGNIIKTEFAEYDELKKVFKSFGPTKILTSKEYVIETEDIIFDDTKKLVSSNKKTNILDQDDNQISLENFSYNTINNIFKSIGYIEILDKNENIYKFSQLYIDTNKKEILGSNVKAFLNDEDFKINENNKPRVFANTIKFNKDKSFFNKSIFTLCNYREKDKCPPWSIQATEMLHDAKKKTIYYDNALIKIYDIPIFYLPKLSHPDPTVDRRSGFLPPSFSDTKNLGSGVSIPYFWAINDDKNFTITNRLFAGEHPLFLGEYQQAFKNSSLLADFGYTKGYKKSSAKKKVGDKSHFFSKFVKNFNKQNKEGTLSITAQHLSNEKYLKLYKIDSNLVDYNSDTLENSINFTHEDDDLFFGINTSVYKTLNENFNDKYEFILPEITLDKNLITNEKVGNLDLQANYKVHKYDTNKLTNFLVNDFYYNSNEVNYETGLIGKFLGNIKNINYETKNVDLYKKDTTSEIYGALGYLTQLNLRKNNAETSHLLKPKMLIRYAPGSMRKESSGLKLDPINAFSIDRLDNKNNFETGLSGSLGFDYKVKKNNKSFDFSIAQIINERENKKMASKTSLDEKLSDLVGSSNYKFNDQVNLKYNFSVDQNYNDLNYSEFGIEMDLNPVKIDFDYLLENKHIGDQEYFTTKVDFQKNSNGLFSFETKRDLITNSAEFYNLSYEYINDCLRAGLVYRREFYSDSELEPENSLMFKITLTPFGNINSPSFNQ